MGDGKAVKKKVSLVICILLVLALGGLILALKMVDVQAAGPLDSQIGLAGINTRFRDLIGQNALMHVLADMLLYTSFAVVLCFGLDGLIQLISGRSLKNVDKGLLFLVPIYLLMAVFYVAFEKYIINYRPILEDGVLEASFPSSHVLMIVTILGTAALELKHLVGNRAGRGLLQFLCILGCIGGIAVVSLHGRHWLTDVAGGVLCAGILISLYAYFTADLDQENLEYED